MATSSRGRGGRRRDPPPGFAGARPRRAEGALGFRLRGPAEGRWGPREPEGGRGEPASPEIAVVHYRQRSGLPRSGTPPVFEYAEWGREPVGAGRERDREPAGAGREPAGAERVGDREPAGAGREPAGAEREGAEREGAEREGAEREGAEREGAGQGRDRELALFPARAPRRRAPSGPEGRVREGRPAPEAPPRERVPVKTSLGVILCRKNPATRRLQVLLVHKRYTYAFAEFVHGRYTRGRIGTLGGAAHRSVSALLDRMTQEELIDLWSLDFGQMWYRVWLTRENKELYNKKHAKFQTTFMREDGGEALRRLISQARANGVLLWEVPKGRRLGAREPDVLCAVRELREEAGVDKREYHLIPEAKRRAVYTSAGTRYVCVYYVAVANPHLSASSAEGHPSSRRALRAVNQMAETSETRWFDIEQIRVLGELGAGDSGHLEALVGPAFRLVKKHLRGRPARRQPPAGGPPPAD